MAGGHGVIESRAEGDFDPLNGVENEKPEVTVEFIEIREVLEAGAGPVVTGQLTVAITDAELQAVASDPIISDLPEPEDGCGWIRNFQASSLKNRDQVLCRSVGLRIDPVDRMIRYKRRRGLVRFRKPESRAAHCRGFYAPDFRVAQGEISECANERSV